MTPGEDRQLAWPFAVSGGSSKRCTGTVHMQTTDACSELGAPSSRSRRRAAVSPSSQLRLPGVDELVFPELYRAHTSRGRQR